MRQLVIFLLVFSAGILSAQNYVQDLSALSDLFWEKKYAEAISQMEILAGKKESPGWLKAGLHCEMSSAYLEMDEVAKSLETLSKAISMGYDDCLSLQEEPFTRIKENEEFQKLLNSINISPADRHELFWLKKEVLSIHHDTQMMVTENINRADSDMTEIPRSVIPVRDTTSAGVLYMREVVRMMQTIQTNVVHKSDLMRVEHNTSMMIIQGGMNPEAIMESQRLTRSRAESRKAEVQMRAFKGDPTASTTPKRCSS